MKCAHCGEDIQVEMMSADEGRITACTCAGAFQEYQSLHYAEMEKRRALKKQIQPRRKR